MARNTPKHGRNRDKQEELEQEPTFEPMAEDTDLSTVVVDPIEARLPRSALAKEIAGEASGDGLVETLKSKRSSVHDINPYDLHLKPGWNKRNFETERRRRRIDELARSIAEVGVREILSAHIEEDKVYVDSGWHRLLGTYRAIEVYGAAVKSIRVSVGRAGENERDRLLGQILTNQGDPPLPYEQGLVCKDLINLGWTVEIIANKIGKSSTNVKALLDLQSLPVEAQKLVDRGTVSAFMATMVFRKYGGNGERTVNALHRAISRANGGRVMPKHLDDAADPPPQNTRAKRRKTRDASNNTKEEAGTGDETQVSGDEPPVARVSALVEACQKGQVIERNEAEGFVLVRYDLDTYETIAVVAQLPDEPMSIEHDEDSESDAASDETDEEFEA